VFVMILWVILTTSGATDSAIATTLWTVGGAAFAIAAVALVPVVRHISHHSIWSHPHFSGATLAQFFYVAAQAGIFSFLINYMTSEVPALPESWTSGWMRSWFEMKDGVMHFSD